MLGAGVYGEAEFIFASIKVITITGLIVSSPNDFQPNSSLTKGR
jgi:amino acid transporter